MEFTPTEISALGWDTCCEVRDKIAEIVDWSFEVRPMLNPNAKERVRRQFVCEEAWRMMVHEKSYGAKHALKALPKILQEVIDSKTEKPAMESVITPVTDTLLLPMNLKDSVEAERVLTALASRKNNGR